MHKPIHLPLTGLLVILLASSSGASSGFGGGSLGPVEPAWVEAGDVLSLDSIADLENLAVQALQDEGLWDGKAPIGCEVTAEDELVVDCRVNDKRAVEVSAGGRHNCALLRTGGLHCWGANDFGESDPYPGFDVRQVSAGTQHTCALLAGPEGKVVCWGSNSSGQVGPIEDMYVEELDETIEVRPQLAMVGAVQVSAGWLHTCAVTTDGNATCWGINDELEDYEGGDAVQVKSSFWLLGTPSGVPWSPQPCVLQSNGNAKCWTWYGPEEGYDGKDAIQIASRGSFVRCALLESGNVNCWGKDDVDPHLGGDAVQVSAGSDHLCALLENGNARCWGSGWAGSYGETEPYEGGDAIRMDVGGNHNCVVVTSGDIHCWGRNSFGQSEPYIAPPPTTRAVAGCQIDEGEDPVCSLRLELGGETVVDEKIGIPV